MNAAREIVDGCITSELKIVKFDNSSTKLAEARPVELVTDPTAEINKLHAEICGAANASIVNAIKIGELLSPIRVQIPHGDWQPWIKRNLTFGWSQAKRYLACYHNRKKYFSSPKSYMSIIALAKIGSTNAKPRKVKPLTFTHAVGDKTATVINPLPSWFSASCAGNPTIIVCRKCHSYSKGHLGMSLGGRGGGAGVSCECKDSERAVEFNKEAK